MTIGSRLKKIRDLMGKTQSDAALESGISQKDLSLLESDHRKFIPKKYIDWLLENGVNLNYVFGGDRFGRIKREENGFILVEEPYESYTTKLSDEEINKVKAFIKKIDEVKHIIDKL